nr:MAG TPA: bacterial toxin [Caudoviricetes sp.]
MQTGAGIFYYPCVFNQIQNKRGVGAPNSLQA